MDRVLVVGPPGSGKTTLGRALAGRLGCPHVEMDALWWEAGWTEAGAEVFRARLETSGGAGERWVLDGNYFSVGAGDTVWPRADTIVWLDLPRHVTVARVLRRTVGRAVRRTELWAGNRESVRLALRPDSIVRYAWTAHPKYNERYQAMIDDPGHGHLTWIRLTSPTAARTWLASCRPPGTMGD